MKRVWSWLVLSLLCIQVVAWGQTIVGPDQMNQCDQATFTVTITNASATQDACFLTVTHSLPNDGFLYVSGSTTITLNETAETFTDDPISDIWDIDAIRGTAYALPSGESITISYDMETTCAAVSGTDIITVDFEDCADPGVPLQNVSSTSVEILPGAILISKTPSVQNTSVGDLVTWTITVENTGLGAISNVEITDILGAGLFFNSATDSGSNTGQVTIWDSGTTPALASIAVGETVAVQLTAEVIACAGLINDVDAAWGCGSSDVCFDTSVDGGTATASLNLTVNNPNLSFIPPNLVIPYCSSGAEVIIPISNGGAGTARNIELCCSLQLLAVTNVQGGASYSNGCFTIPDIAPGATFNLTFDVVYSGDWCAGGPSGTNIFELSYANDCGIPFVARPQFSTLSSESGPSLAVTKTGPDSLRLGETGTYDITVEYVGDLNCNGGSAGTFAIVDTYPDGFSVIDVGGGIHDPGTRTITWAYDPSIDPPFAESVQLQATNDCGYCAGSAGGGTDDNTVNVTGIDCCGCTITGNASAPTTILCEGYGDGTPLFISTMEISTDTVLRCSSDYNVTVTHTYTFIDDPALDDFLLNEFVYFVDGNNDLYYETGTASVIGATLGTITDGTPAGRLELELSDNASVRGKTIIYSYELNVLGLGDPSCQASSYPIYAGIELESGATSVGYCGTMYGDPPAPTVTAQPPAMAVSIEGIPVIQEYCATHDVTITLERTSSSAVPYDVRLELTNSGGSILDMSQAVCGGNTNPIDGTTCTTPIEVGNIFEWRFADAFATGNTATITFPVTVPCGGPLADLSVVASFDDLCHDDSVYDDSCTTASSDDASLSLSADVYTRKSPEILYATTRYVSWSVVVYNTGNGVAYNTWVDDALGNGLIYDSAHSSIDNATGAAEYPNLDHNGGAINGVSWIIDELQPGELRTITVAAELVACVGLTNDISAAWGCGGSDCQAPRTDTSSVVIPPANLIATSFSPTPAPMCSDNPATVTVKNSGVTTVYNIIANVTLPNGLIYLGNPQVQINGGGWSSVPDPNGVPGPNLTWTSAEIPALSEADPHDVIEIRFNYTVLCGFEGGNLEFQASYEDPCTNLQSSNIGRFTIGLTPAEVLVAIRQVSPPSGEAIDCGSQVTWEIDVTNDGSIVIPVVRVEALLDDGLTFVDSGGDSTYGPADGGSNSGQTVVWELANLPVGAVATLSITAASVGGGLDCEALDVFIDASWGCGIVDGSSATDDAACTTVVPTTTSISATREPPLDLSASLLPDSIEGCDATTTLTLTIQNTGTTSTASNIDAIIDLPAQLSYANGTTEIDCGSGFSPATNPNISGQTLTWYDIAAEGGASDICESIPPGGSIRLRFDVDVSCYFITQDIPIDVYFFDCCAINQYNASTTATLTALTPSLAVDKSPANITLDCYDASDTATWTITVENTGLGTADWIRLTDTLGASLVLDSSNSPTAGTGVSMGANVIGWEIGPLAPAETFTATVTAHLDQPSNDCSLSLRRDTAAVTWGCGAFDGDPNTTAEATCDIGSSVQDRANVRIPNLSISPSDITPILTCAGDGVAPSSGEIGLVVRNSGDGDVTADFEITLTETTTGYSVSDRFTNLGGTLPLADGTSQTLTFSSWDVGCSECDYVIVAALDFLDEVCECREDDNLASLPTTITMPDLIIESEDLALTCYSDGQIRIQGSVALRNDGCGDPLTDDISVRFRIFDGANCTGNQIDTFTQVFSGMTLAANGGTDQQSINITRTLDTCDTCQVSIQIEVDEDDAICECSGANNTLCAGNFSIAFPDLTITDVDFSGVTCAVDSIAGIVRVTVGNTGCGDSGAFTLRLTTDGCLSFSDEVIVNLAAGNSTTVGFAITGAWAGCGDCACIFTATIDPSYAVCECDGTNNALSEPFASTLPDLEISGAVASIGCAADGNATVNADVTIENTGCTDVVADFDVLVTIYDGTNCTGTVVDTWIETIFGETVSAGGSNVITLTERILSQSLCAGDCDYSARFEVDANNDICECDGTDNLFCLSSIPSEIPNLVVTDVDPVVDCQAGTAQVTVTVGNTGCGDATGVIFRLTSPACGLSIDHTPIDLATGASQDIVFAYTPNCGAWNCTYTVTADPGSAICECDGANTLMLDPYPGIGSIGDRVWFDFNGDGVQDPGEDGIPSVTIIIEGDLDGDGVIDYTAEVATDANGEYLLDELPAGDYTLTIDETTLPDGLNQTYDYDGLGTPHTSDYTLTENEHNREQDFGYRGSGSIGDYVWFDVNGDGVQDSSEDGIENVTVTLHGDVDGDGIDEIVTTTTDADGLYLFDFLPAGDYTITVDDTTLPDGLAQTYDYDGLGTAHTSNYTLVSGEHNREQDFGYSMPALSVDKTITDILRSGASIGNITGPVEPGDIIVYQFVIENVGPVPAYSVGFEDMLPTGVVTEIDTPGNAGAYTVTAPAASGTLALADGVNAFTASIDATINAGETLTATFTAIVTSAVTQGVDLTNTAHAFGLREDGTPIPPENVLLGDTSDTDVEDPDADDTGIVTVGVLVPALSVDKTITDITRGGVSIGISGPVEPGDIVSYRFVITNVGGGTAHDVEFADTLPPGMETEAGGTYAVSDPPASGSLGLAAGAASFTTNIDAVIGGGESLTADFSAIVTSDVVQGVDLVNTAEATGIDGFGSEIPDENLSIGDTSDDDAEDPDADDTGIAVIGTEEPALSVDKSITDILRRGASIGNAGPVEPGDIVFYCYTITNVGLGTAYGVEFTDTLPTGMVTEIDAPASAGSYIVTDPAASGTLALSDGVSTFTTSIGAVISGGETLVANYTVLITSDIEQSVDLINVATATGLDGAGNSIPGENADLGDISDEDAEDPDADDTGITVLGTIEPALSVDKRVTDVIRGDISVGVVDPLLYGDVIEYTVTIRNVGLGTAYEVEFTDAIPAGLETETDAPGNAGSFSVTAPAASGSLSVSDAVTAFTTSMKATITGGGILTAVYTVLVTPTATPAIDLVNTVSAMGEDGAEIPIPAENAAIGDTTDDDAEDPDPDDTGIAIIRIGSPALVTRKSVAAIDRQGASISGTSVEPGDIVTYKVGVTNVGTGPAQSVNLLDVLPAGFVYHGNTSATWPSGSSTDDPTGTPGLTLNWMLNADLEPGEELVLHFDARVTSGIEQAGTYTNMVTATGEDSAGQPIPPDHRDVVPEDDDPDDSSDVSLIGTVPALVTDKAILNIVRNGSSLGPETAIQSFDIVTYQLRITNVGLGIAYGVDVRDTLPNPFSFVSGTTQASWPYRTGAFTRNPTSAPGPTLLWDTDATLASGESLTMTFEALVDGFVNTGGSYTNVLQATGIDGAETPIPPNRSADVSEDTDPDDRDEVSLTSVTESPALITTKQVTAIIRSGNFVIDSRIEGDDIVEYELTVQNVGAVAATNVNITDQLPTEFGYIDDTASVTWPLGSSFADPTEWLTQLQWSLNATLRPGDRLVLRFRVLVVGPIYDGTAYTNSMKATGCGPDGSPIPEDQRSLIPGDIDPDDASQATLLGRSAYIQGEGGLITVPILRKSAKVLSAEGCQVWSTSVDRLWFQTDIAMYAAAEFELLSRLPDTSSLIPNSLLPTWTRTVQSETLDYAFDNMMQVDALSSVGVALSNGPLIRERAKTQGIGTHEALDRRLNDLAIRAVISDTWLPLSEEWIFLEYEGGEPLYETWRDGPLGPSGRWTLLDEDIIASALGMGLLKQVMEAETLLASKDPTDRYLGWVLVEILSNKILALEADLTIRSGSSTAYVPHSIRWDNEAEAYVVQDETSLLFDQLSLVWGLSRTVSFVENVDEAWPADERELRARVGEAVDRTLHEVLVAIDSMHLTSSQEWLGSYLPGSSESSTASTVDLGLLLVAFESAHAVVGTNDGTLLDHMSLSAIDTLVGRQDADGWFPLYEEQDEAHTWSLLSQVAGIRGILAGSNLCPSALDVARAAFDALDRELWVDAIGNGLYSSHGTPGWRTYCYTPLEIGLTVGALRELALQSTDERSAHILTRMSGFVRTIVDKAALQLSNALPSNAAFTRGDGTGSITPIRTDDLAGPLAPVLQQRLCLSDDPSEDPCSGWRVLERDPWYQTDISMFAAYVLQDRMPRIDDYADANLNTVTLHSGLGIPFESISALKSAVERFSLESDIAEISKTLSPIAIPFTAGNPETATGTLAWNASSFDTRILASAQGMTLLREAQEVHQLLDKATLEPHEQLQKRVLLSAILQKLVVLQQLQLDGPGNVSYIPHAVQWNENAGDSWTVLDRTSTTFDQLSLLHGLSEAYALLADIRVRLLIEKQPFPAVNWETVVLDLVDDVMRTLEIAHLDSLTNVLIDVSEPTLSNWTRGGSLSTVNLGLLTTAFDHVLMAFGESSSIGERALRLLKQEVAFLQEQLIDTRGGFDESWPRETGPAAKDCATQTLTGQLAALRALQAAKRWLGLDREIVERVFRTLDARFWDPSLCVYRTQRSLFEWCVTPLDLGLTIDALSRMADQLTDTELTRLDTRLASHVDRILDGVPLQLSDGIESLDGYSAAQDRYYAPVFDARACFRPSMLTQGAGWAEPGDTISYTVSAENATGDAFYSLVLEDRLPAGVTVLATDPVGELDDPIIRWSFDELLPSEERTWQILVRVDEDASVGDVFENCATLTYTNVAGEPQPPRDACADVEILSPEDGLANLLDSVNATYLTDEAMHLAKALETLACIPDSDWQNATLAHQLADANLGVLMGESGLGIPLRFAPQLSTNDNRNLSLEETLNGFASTAGLPEFPAFGHSIFLPHESGVPIVWNGSGFSTTNDVITPAALGWTLAREAQYVRSCERSDNPLDRYLIDWVRFAMDNKLTWISASTISSETGGSYLPRAIRATIVGEEISYGVSDTRSTVYDQASLLIGLLTAAQTDVLGSRGQRLAEQLAAETFEQLVRHWNVNEHAFTEPLETGDPSSSAQWYDNAIAAQALLLSRDFLTQRRDTADELLETLAERALSQDPEMGAVGEAGRLLTLLIAAGVTNENRYRSAALAEWEAFLEAYYDQDTDGFVLSPQAARGWGHTPGELSIVFDLLGQLVRIPDERAAALRVASSLLLTNVAKDRVQLVSPARTWFHHVQIPCSGLAPAFAKHRGNLPEWFHFLP